MHRDYKTALFRQLISTNKARLSIAEFKQVQLFFMFWVWKAMDAPWNKTVFYLRSSVALLFFAKDISHERSISGNLSAYCPPEVLIPLQSRLQVGNKQMGLPDKWPAFMQNVIGNEHRQRGILVLFCLNLSEVLSYSFISWLEKTKRPSILFST